jgi:hypothetical protein
VGPTAEHNGAGESSKIFKWAAALPIHAPAPSQRGQEPVGSVRACVRRVQGCVCVFVCVFVCVHESGQAGRGRRAGGVG